MSEAKNQSTHTQEARPGKVAFAMRLGRAPGRQGLYLPIQTAILQEGQGAIYSDGFKWAEKVPLDQFHKKAEFYLETGELDAKAKLDGDLEISLRNDQKAEVTLMPGSQVSYRYLYDEKTDTAMYGAVGPSEEVVVQAAKHWQESQTKS